MYYEKCINESCFFKNVGRATVRPKCHIETYILRYLIGGEHRTWTNGSKRETYFITSL